jgi:hypothetical protein
MESCVGEDDSVYNVEPYARPDIGYLSSGAGFSPV